ncbi:uncharacterized protein Tco025E_08057 [Trypanosoma conorhini]|uniref:Uncharacterized protein n=1 Tax=Trypanosoma conorhini TaxID=83891 RepID=A0A3R7KLK2_9TRYP|nr:uncharacterized protein Tco025E_08057 [Trypanosoma conorhini]RNF03950.1 hypothetical protein Tco025E_08057 [Trypanosoma conorhini]
MTSHAPPKLLGRMPSRKPNQHHLPPLLPPSSPPTTEPISPVGCRAIAPQPTSLSGRASRRGSASLRNCCSVTKMGFMAEADSRHAARHSEEDVVSYAVKHQLPNLVNDMIEDLLRERPEEDVEGWIFRWFAREYERRQLGSRQLLVRSRFHSFRRDAASREAPKMSGEPFLVRSSSSVSSARRGSRTTLPCSGTVLAVGGPAKEEVATESQPRAVLGSPQCNTVMYSPPPMAGIVARGVTVPLPSDFAPTSGSPLITTIIAQRSLPFPRDPPQLSAGEEETVVPRIPRGADFRLKSRSPHTVDVCGNKNNNSDGSLAPSPV